MHDDDEEGRETDKCWECGAKLEIKDKVINSITNSKLAVCPDCGLDYEYIITYSYDNMKTKVVKTRKI